jgi:peptidoglycan hydrolase CwlO-like protein
MERIEIDVITGERKIIALTEEDIAQANTQYQEWLSIQPTVEEQISRLQAQINRLQQTGTT